MTPVRSTPDRSLVDQWALVLASAGIHSHIVRRAEGWELAVASRDVERAARVLDLYERENAERPREGSRFPQWGPTRVGFAMAGLLVAFYGVTGPRRSGVGWFERGSATAERILEGEWWRTVTALTLHADAAHVLANAVTAALFGTAVCRWVGPGLGAVLVLGAGAFGNALNAWVHGAEHSSVGASTAIFGAVGLLGGLGLAQGLVLGLRRSRVWAPLAACLGLLALLGTGERTDVWAHGFGFLCGVGLGVLAGAAVRKPPSAPVQFVLLVAGAGTVVGCWILARG